MVEAGLSKRSMSYTEKEMSLKSVTGGVSWICHVAPVAGCQNSPGVDGVVEVGRETLVEVCVPVGTAVDDDSSGSSVLVGSGSSVFVGSGSSGSSVFVGSDESSVVVGEGSSGSSVLVGSSGSSVLVWSTKVEVGITCVLKVVETTGDLVVEGMGMTVRVLWAGCVLECP